MCKGTEAQRSGSWTQQSELWAPVHHGFRPRAASPSFVWVFWWLLDERTSAQVFKSPFSLSCAVHGNYKYWTHPTMNLLWQQLWAAGKRHKPRANVLCWVSSWLRSTGPENVLLSVFNSSSFLSAHSNMELIINGKEKRKWSDVLVDCPTALTRISLSGERALAVPGALCLQHCVHIPGTGKGSMEGKASLGCRDADQAEMPICMLEVLWPYTLPSQL